MTQPIPTTTALLPEGITRLTIQPTDYGTVWLVDPGTDDTVAAIVPEGTQFEVQIHAIELLDVVHSGSLAAAVRWAEQALAEIEHVERTGDEPDYVAVPPRPHADRAAQLRRIADALEASDADLWGVTVSAQVTRANSAGPQEVDALARAAGYAPGAAKEMSNGTWHHVADSTVGRVELYVYCGTTPPADRDPAALAARVAELEAQLAAAQGGAA